MRNVECGMMRDMIRYIYNNARVMLLIAVALCTSSAVKAQQWSVKTNLLSDAITVPSISSEYRISLRWTVNLDLAWMPLRQSSEHYLRTFKIQPEAHYWFRAPFTGPFIGPALSWRQYNMGGLFVFHTSDRRTQGFLLGAGCTAGWHFTLSNRWGLEPSLTLGYAYAKFRRYDSPRSIVPVKRWEDHYIGPTAATLQLVYMLK